MKNQQTLTSFKFMREQNEWPPTIKAQPSLPETHAQLESVIMAPNEHEVRIREESMEVQIPHSPSDAFPFDETRSEERRVGKECA